MEIIEEKPELKSKILKLNLSKLVSCSTPGNHKKTILVEYQKLREKFTIESIKILTDEFLKRLQYIIDSFAISEEYKQIEKLLQDSSIDIEDIVRLGLREEITMYKYYQIEQLKITIENINVLKDEERLRVTTILGKLINLFNISKDTENEIILKFAIDALFDIERMKEEYLTILQKIIDSFAISEENKQVIRLLQKIIFEGDFVFIQDEYNNLSQKVDEIVSEIRKSQEPKQEKPQEKNTIKTYTKRMERPSKFKRKF